MAGISYKNKFQEQVKKVDKLSTELEKEIERKKNLELRISEKENKYQQLLGKIGNADKSLTSSKDKEPNYATRVTAIMTAILALIAIFQFLELEKQNFSIKEQVRLMENQNASIDFQNVLIKTQNDKIKQQTHLAEAERISQLNILTNSVLNDLNHITQHVPDQRKHIKLKKSISARIITLSHYLKPYSYLEAGELVDPPISPERGLLLASLMNHNISNQSMDHIYKFANFRQSDLKNINLKNKHLQSIDLKGANLQGAILEKANLAKPDLRRANLRGTFVLDVELENYFNKENGIIENTNLKNCNFSGADLTDADGRGADFTEANFSGALLKKMDFNSAFLKRANFEGANLNRANLYLAHLNNTNLKKANLSGANLELARLNYANLSNANLKKANLTGANLELVCLNNANLSNADLTNVLNINYEQLIKAKSLHGTKGIPDSIFTCIEEYNCTLLEK